MAACGPADIYKALLGAGFTTIQAVGIMANGIAESGLNPETRVVDSNGYYSNGFLQFNEASYPGSGSLVTGNCQADIAAQVGKLKASVSGQALTGSNAAEVAGNFAQYFEVCASCTPGGASYDQRVANAATVAGWVDSGKWPTAATGSVTGSGGSASGGGGQAPGPDCAFSLGGGKIGAAGVGVTLPTVCLLQRATIRHMVGGGLMVAGGTVSIFGVILLAAFAFRASGAARAAGQVAQTFTPAGRVYKRATKTSQAARKTTGKAAAPARQAAAPARRAAAPARQRGPAYSEVTTERAPIESESGGTRIITQRRNVAGGRERIHNTVVEKTPGRTLGSTRTSTRHLRYERPAV